MFNITFFFHITLFHRLYWYNIFTLFKRIIVSGVASPLCQEGQSKRTFLIFAFPSRFFLFFPIFSLSSRNVPDFSQFLPLFPSFSPLFPDFFPLFPIFGIVFRCQGGHAAHCPPTGYATDYCPGYCHINEGRGVKFYETQLQFLS